MRFLFNAIDRGEGHLLRQQPCRHSARDAKQEHLQDRRILLASAVFIGINLLAIIGFGKFGAAGAIAWEAHVGGYLFGLLAFGAFDTAAQNETPHTPNSD